MSVDKDVITAMKNVKSTSCYGSGTVLAQFREC